MISSQEDELKSVISDVMHEIGKTIDELSKDNKKLCLKLLAVCIIATMVKKDVFTTEEIKEFLLDGIDNLDIFKELSPTSNTFN